jgi:SOS-response transcriptional repressor LexA
MLKSEKPTWRVMNCIYDFCEVHLRTPKIREIMRELNISSTSPVDYHLDKLEDWGYIARERRVSGGCV